MVRRAVALLLAVVSLSLAVPAGGAVVIKATFANGSNVFKPKRTEVAVGTRVVWKAVSGTHTVTAYGGNWSKNVTISTGETTGKRFTAGGVYKYYCNIHGDVVGGVCSGMCGKVVVG
jgi:plastocyanin